jgi:hypothetical protein
MHSDAGRPAIGDAGHSVGASDAGQPESGKNATPPAEHNIVERRCGSPRFSQGFSLMPIPGCTGKPGTCYGVQCTRPEDCTAHPFGRCLSSAEGHCVYASGTDPLPVCVEDSACTKEPNGQCTGTLTYAVCQYNNQCATDADCPTQHKCDCNANGDLFCAFVECSGDGDCAQGERCLRTNPCNFGPYGDYRCTTPADECEPYAADGGCRCDFDRSKRHWACNNIICD